MSIRFPRIQDPSRSNFIAQRHFLEKNPVDAELKLLHLNGVKVLQLETPSVRRDEAHTMLAEIYGWFAEGFVTADLQEAKALLNELGR